MEIINRLGKRTLKNLLFSIPENTKCIKVAVAYVQDLSLITDLHRYNTSLHLWSRGDGTSHDVCEFFLNQSKDFKLKLIKDDFHAKVFWIKNYGAYIGSDNLTKKAFEKNLECGVWFTSEDLKKFKFVSNLEFFFDEVDKQSTPINQDILNAIKKSEEVKKESSDLKNKANKDLNRLLKNVRFPNLNLNKEQHAEELSFIERKQKNKEFFNEFIQEVKKEYDLKLGVTNSARLNISKNFSDINVFRAIDVRHRIGVDWRVHLPKEASDLKLHPLLRKDMDNEKNKFFKDFHSSDDSDKSILGFYSDKNEFPDIYDPKTYEDQKRWLKEHLVEFYKCMKKHIDNLESI